MPPVIVVAHVEVKPGSAEIVKKMLQELKKSTHSKESHRITLYEPVQDLSDENKFAVHEQWNSAEDLDAHMQEKHFTDLAEEIQQYLAHPSALTIGRYQVVRGFASNNV